MKPMRDAETDAETEGDTAAAMSGPITVISREEGSAPAAPLWS